jgi:hypothetical protein
MIQNNQEKMDANLMEIRAGQEHLKEEMLTKMETNRERMDAKIDTNQENIEARIEANNETF